MNKNLNNMTLRGGYTGIISLETFYVNIFQTYATQDYAIVLMRKKHETCRIRICNVFF